MGLKTFVLKMAQAEARIWPRLSYVYRIRSTAAQRAPEKDAALRLERELFIDNPLV